MFALCFSLCLCSLRQVSQFATDFLRRKEFGGAVPKSSATPSLTTTVTPAAVEPVAGAVPKGKAGGSSSTPTRKKQQQKGK